MLVTTSEKATRHIQWEQQ